MKSTRQVSRCKTGETFSVSVVRFYGNFFVKQNVYSRLVKTSFFKFLFFLIFFFYTTLCPFLNLQAVGQDVERTVERTVGTQVLEPPPVKPELAADFVSGSQVTQNVNADDSIKILKNMSFQKGKTVQDEKSAKNQNSPRIHALTKRDSVKNLYQIKLQWPECDKVALFFYRGFGYMVFAKPGILQGGTFPSDYFESVELIPHESSLIVKFKLADDMDIQMARVDDEWLILTGELKNEMPLNSFPLKVDVSADQLSVSLKNPDQEKVIMFHDPETQDQFYAVPDEGRGISDTKKQMMFSILATYQGVVVLNKAPEVLDVKLSPQSETLTFLRRDQKPLAATPPEKWEAGSIPPLVDLSQFDIDPDDILLYQRILQAKIQRADNAATRLIHEENLAKFYLSVGMFAESAGVVELIKQKNPGYFYALDRLLMLYDLSHMLAHNVDDDQLKTNTGDFEKEPEREIILAIHEHRYGRDKIALQRFIQGYKYIAKLPKLIRNDISMYGFSTALNVRFTKPIFQSLVQPRLMTWRERDEFSLYKLRALQINDPNLKLNDSLSKLTFSRNLKVALLAHLAMANQQTLHVKSMIKDLESIKFQWRGDIVEQRFLGTLADLYLRSGETREALRCLRTISAYLWKLERSYVYMKKAEDIFYRSFMAMDQKPLLMQLGYYYEFEDISPRGQRYGDILKRVTDLYMQVGLYKDALDTLNRKLHFLDYEKKRKTLTDSQYNYLANLATKRMAEIFFKQKDYNQSLKTLDALIPLHTNDANVKDILSLTTSTKLLKTKSYLGLKNYTAAEKSLEGMTSMTAKRLRADALIGQKKWLESFMVLGDMLETIKKQPQYEYLETDAILDTAVVISHLEDPEMLEALVGEFADRIQDPEKRQAFDMITAQGVPVDVKKAAIEKQIQVATEYASLMDGIEKDIMDSTWKQDGSVVDSAQNNDASSIQ